jgi:hypothetical protein
VIDVLLLGKAKLDVRGEPALNKETVRSDPCVKFVLDPVMVTLSVCPLLALAGVTAVILGVFLEVPDTVNAFGRIKVPSLDVFTTREYTPGVALEGIEMSVRKVVLFWANAVGVTIGFPPAKPVKATIVLLDCVNVVLTPVMVTNSDCP